MTLTRHSEPYAPTGALSGQGVLNQLGRPDIEPLEVLVREAIQNCWDAKRGDSNEVEVEIGRIELDEARRAVLADRVLPGPPPGLPLADALDRGTCLLHFADFGTSGLGGPTRADAVTPGAVSDFVDFARNIGQPPDKEFGGGSFGYGKAAFHVASSAQTILVDTLCRFEGSLERRFLGLGLGDTYHDGSGPHTGRHWWGVFDAEGVPEPATGDDAVALARALGLPDREGDAGCGTTVVVVAPGYGLDEDAETAADAMRFIAQTLAWNFWPRMVGGAAGRRTMRFRVRDGERSVPVPDPRRDARLKVFATAMDRLREEPAPTDDPFIVARTIEIRRPAEVLGRLVVVRTPSFASGVPERLEPEGAALTRSGLHHVALMRNAELVVRYLRGPEPIAGHSGYAGAFRCALSVDEIFRRSEPPTHDDWIARSIADRTERSFVKVALERIRDVCREVAGFSSIPAAAGAEAVSLGEFADGLATLMPGSIGIGARRQPFGPQVGRPPGGGGKASHGGGDGMAGATVDGRQEATGEGATSGRRPVVRVRDRPAPRLVDGRAMLAFPFELRTVGCETRVKARIDVVTHDGLQTEDDPPQGSNRPVAELWIAPDGAATHADQIVVPAGGDGAWTVLAALDQQVMLRADITCEPA